MACSQQASPPSSIPSTPPPTQQASPPSVFACRLPVVIRRRGVPDTAGFLANPGGGFTPANANGVRYDVRRDRWLPPGLPTPDGAGYVYADDAGAIHLLTLDSGLDRAIVTGAWWPVGFVGDRLYLVEQRPIEGGGHTFGGLAQISLSGGTPTLITNHTGLWSVSSLGAWSSDRADGFQQAPDRVLHLDLATGAIEPWLSGVGNVTVIGFDAGGHPFAVSQGAVRVLLLMNPGDSREVYSGPQDGWPEAPSFVDGDRVWFSGFSIKYDPISPAVEAPVWLYQPGVGLQPSVGVPGASVSVAGPCI